MTCSGLGKTSGLQLEFWVVLQHLVSVRTFSVMYSYTILYVCKLPDQTSGYTLSGLLAWWWQMTTSIFFRGLCGYVWLTHSFVNKKLEERTCEICHSDVIEDECHFLFNCPVYETPRNYWVTSLINKCPNFHTLELKEQLMFIFNEAPRSTAKFIKSCLAIRKSILYNV